MKKNKAIFITKASVAEISVEDENIISEMDIPDSSDANKGLEKQKDLMKLISVLVSTGQNKNDDVFLKEELLPVRNTGAHKPVNIEHNEHQIIGHITRSFVTTKSGERIDDKEIEKDPKSVPKNFDLTNEAVIYKFLFPSVAKTIKEKSQNNDLFVSVEMWFSDYDYLVGSKIIKRNQATAAVLDSKLRINGGDGEFKGEKVGRVLREMLIGGMGVVENPANPESVIKSVGSVKETNIKKLDDLIVKNIMGDINKSESNLKEEDMTEDIVKELQELTEAAKIKLSEEKDTNVEVEDNAVDTDIQSLKEKNEELEKRILAFETDKIARERVDHLVEMLECDLDFAKSKSGLIKDMSKEQFDEYVEELKSWLNYKLTKSGESVEPEKSVEDVKDESVENAEEKSESNVASEEDISEVLDDVEKVDTDVNVESEEPEDLSSKISKVLQNILQSRNSKFAKVNK